MSDNLFGAGGMHEAEANHPGIVYRHGWTHFECPDCADVIYDGRVEAGWGRLKRAIEQEQARAVEQRSAVVDAGRARWGRGFTIGITEGAWTSATDGHGRLVAPEDWGVFRAYLEAADAEKFAAIASVRGPW